MKDYPYHQQEAYNSRMAWILVIIIIAVCIFAIVGCEKDDTKPSHKNGPQIDLRVYPTNIVQGDTVWVDALKSSTDAGFTLDSLKINMRQVNGAAHFIKVDTLRYPVVYDSIGSFTMHVGIVDSGGWSDWAKCTVNVARRNN